MESSLQNISQDMRTVIIFAVNANYAADIKFRWFDDISS